MQPKQWGRASYATPGSTSDEPGAVPHDERHTVSLAPLVGKTGRCRPRRALKASSSRRSTPAALPNPMTRRRRERGSLSTAATDTGALSHSCCWCCWSCCWALSAVASLPAAHSCSWPHEFRRRVTVARNPLPVEPLPPRTRMRSTSMPTTECSSSGSRSESSSEELELDEPLLAESSMYISSRRAVFASALLPFRNSRRAPQRQKSSCDERSMKSPTREFYE